MHEDLQFIITIDRIYLCYLQNQTLGYSSINSKGGKRMTALNILIENSKNQINMKCDNFILNLEIC